MATASREAAETEFAGHFMTEIVHSEIERRILLVHRSGSGNVYFILLSGDKQNTVDPDNIDVYREKWEQLYMLKDFGICWHDDYLYIIGGFSQKTNAYCDTVRRYHTLHDVWEDLPPMLHARSNFASVFCNGKLYVTGGVRSNGKLTKSCEAFNFYTMTWTRVGMLPYVRKDHQIATDGKIVYISGGCASGRLHANIWLSEDYTWNKMDDDYPTTMSVCRSRHSMEHYQGTLYFIGGLTTPKSLGRIAKIPDEQLYIQNQLHHSTLPETATQHDREEEHIPDIDSSMESFMPFVTSSVLDDTNFISPWDWGLPPLKHARYGAASIIVGDKLLVIGGKGTDNKVVSRAEVYDFKQRAWADSFVLPSSNIGHVSCVQIKCSADRRKQHSPEAPDIWSKYKWILW